MPNDNGKIKKVNNLKFKKGYYLHPIHIPAQLPFSQIRESKLPHSHTQAMPMSAKLNKRSRSLTKNPFLKEILKVTIEN